MFRLTIFTADELKDKIRTYETALEHLASAQSYTISTEDGSQTVTRSSAAQLRRQINEWYAQLQELEGPGVISVHGDLS